MKPEVTRSDTFTGLVPSNDLQAALYRQAVLDLRNPSYNLCLKLTLFCQLNTQALKASLSKLALRHELLRAQVRDAEHGPTFHVHSDASIPLRAIELVNQPDAKQECEHLLLQEFRRPFDVDETHLIRALLVSISKNEHVLGLTAHQIIVDREALTLVVREIAELYGSAIENRQPSFAATHNSTSSIVARQSEWRKTPAGLEELRWWQRRLAARSPFKLPNDLEDSSSSYWEASSVQRTLPSDLIAALNEFANHSNSSLPAVLLSGFAALLSRVTGNDDLLIGYPSSVRNVFAAEGVVSNFSNLLPLRIDGSVNQEVNVLVEQIRSVVSEAVAHNRTPLADIFQTSHSELTPDVPIRVCFELLRENQSLVQLPELTVLCEYAGNSATSFDLYLQVIQREEDTAVVLEYRTSRFSSRFASELLDAWLDLLRAAILKPSLRIYELPPQPFASAESVDHGAGNGPGLTMAQLSRWRDWIKGQTNSAVSILLKDCPHDIATKLSDLSQSHPALHIAGLDYRQGQLSARMSSTPVVEEECVNSINDFDLASLCSTRSDLRQGPLIRVIHLPFTRDNSVVLTIDPVVADSLSAAPLMKALTANVALSSPDPASIAAMQASSIGDPINRTEAEGFWRRMLWNAPWNSTAGADVPAAVGSSLKTKLIETTLDENTWRNLVQACENAGCPVWSAVLAAYSAVACAREGSTSVVIEILAPTTTRPNGVGAFVTSLPACLHAPATKALVEIVKDVATTVEGAFARGYISRERILQMADASSDSRPMLGFHSLDLPVTDNPLHAKAKAYLLHPGESNEVANLYVSPYGDGACVQLAYATQAFHDESADAILGQVIAFLASFAANQTNALTPAVMFRPGERELVLDRFNNTDAQLGQERLLDSLIVDQAQATPDHTAVRLSRKPHHGPVEITYRELLDSADALAEKLLEMGVNTGDVVGIHAERSIELAVGLLGILRAGAVFLPLDPEHPPPRLQHLVEDAGAVVVLAQPDFDVGFPGADVLRLDMDQLQQPRRDQSLNSGERRPSDPAYLLYTSGSTGQPKGVVIPHRAICNRLLWMQAAYALNSQDQVLQKTSVSFDVSVWEFFWPWIAGATLVMCPPAVHRDPFSLARVIEDEKITTLHFVPSMLRAYVDHGGLRHLHSVRRIICSGESLTPDLVDEVLAGCSASLYNLYGPTEAAIDVTAHECRKGERPVPIGRPISNIRIRIVDRGYEPVGVGHVGQIWIEGIGLATEYLFRPDLTEERFIRSPFVPGERMYCSGDLGRWTPNGEIEFLGRADDQLKVRGIRIEPGEIEAKLRSLLVVNDAAVVMRKGADGRGQLSAFVEVRDRRVSSTDLRTSLEAELPASLVPNVINILLELPRVRSGKIDRATLQSQSFSITPAVTAYVPPQTDQQRLLCEIWQQILGVERVGIDSDFFALGGDSLRAIEIVAQARAQGIGLQLQALFEARTVSGLGTLPAWSSHPDPYPPFKLLPEGCSELPGDIVDAYPLPALMSGLVFESQTNPFYLIYTTCVEVRGPYFPDLFQQILMHAVAAHPLLRATVMLDGKPEPLLAIHSEARASVDYVDLQNLPVDEQDDRLSAFLERERRRRFDWTSAPLMRTTVLQRSERSFELVLAEPFLDGWSATLLLTQILSAYARKLTGEQVEPSIVAPRANYAEFVEAQSRIASDPQVRLFWENKLQDVEPSLLPASFAGNSSDGPQVRIDVPLTPELSDSLIQTSVKLALPLKSLLLAAHVHVVSALSSRDEVVTGLMSHGRPEVPESDTVLGLFLNTVPLVLNANATSWKELARLCFTSEIETLPAKSYPYSHLIPQHGVLFDMAFNFTHFRPYRELIESTGLGLRRIWASDQTYFPITAHFRFDPIESKVRLRLDIDPARVNTEAAQRIAFYYQRSLESLSLNPDAEPDPRNLLTESERRLIGGSAQPAANYIASRIDSLFVEQAYRTPDALALIEQAEEFSYRDLLQRSAALAAELRRRGIGPGDRVAHWLEPSAAAIAACLAIAGAGAAFVPFSTLDPPERLARLQREADVRLVIVSNDREPQWCDVDVLPVPRNFKSWQVATDFPSPIGSADDALHVLFTSGSTGRPKGVVTAHRTVLNRLQWAWDIYPFQPGERLCLKTPFTFVDSIWEIFGGLLQRIPTAIAPIDVSRNPDELVTFLSRSGATRVTLVPSLLAEILSLRRPLEKDLRKLRQIVVSGEPFPASLGRALREHLPHALVLNLYGSTEVAGDVTAYEVTGLEESAIIPLGTPIANCQIEIVDEHLRPAPLGVPGEILVRGPVLAEGYLGNAAEQGRFVETDRGRAYRTGDLAYLRADGVIEYGGRRDKQFKVRGIRIQAEEVEAVLEEHPQVVRAAVDLRDVGGRMSLMAWLQTTCSDSTFQSTMQRHAFDRLSPVAVPERYFCMDCLPLTASGKIDYSRLPAIPPRTRGAAPTTPVAKALAAMWEEVLVVPQVGLDDDFLELGGHSLTIIKILVRVEERFGVRLSPQEFIECRNVGNLAALVEARVLKNFEDSI